MLAYKATAENFSVKPSGKSRHAIKNISNIRTVLFAIHCSETVSTSDITVLE